MPAGLRFITDNPFTKSYREGQEFRQAERMREQNLKNDQQQYDIREERRPYDLRRTAADTDVAESNSRVATGTEGAKITTAGNDARRSGTLANEAEFNYGEAQANAPNVRRERAAQASGAETEAEQRAQNLRESTAMAPDRRRQMAAQADQAGTSAKRSALELSDYEKNHTFMATLDFLEKGDIAGAKAYAERNGVPIPDDVLNNASMMNAIKNLSAMAKDRFPNRPNDQAEWMKIQLKGMTDELGRAQYNPAQAVTSDAGPRPPEQVYGLGRPSAASKAEAFAGTMSVEDNRLLVRLEAANKHNDPANPVAPPQLDEAAVARNLVQMGRPDLARIYDPTVPQPQQPQPQARPGTAPTMSQPQPAPGPQGATPGAPQAQIPPVPQPLAAIQGLKYSPSRQQFRDPQTNAVYDIRGNRVQ